MTWRNVRAAALVGLVLGLAIGIVADVFGSGRSPSAFAAPQATGRINVTAVQVHQGYRFERPAGRAGDGVDQSWGINDRRGKPIGRMLLTCRWVLARARMCVGEITMPLGKITFAGSSPTSFEGEYALTGGTGAYRSAGGVMLFTAIGLRKTVLLITVET